MNIKVFYVLIINLVHFVFCFEEFHYISDCHIQSYTDSYAVTFICGETDNSPNIFTSDYVECSGNDVGYQSLGKIDFENCQFRGFDSEFFKNYTQLRELDISDLGLEKIQIGTFEELPFLTIFNVSYNRLATLPSKLLSTAKSLVSVDFSNNMILQIYGSDFVGASNLTVLNLSHNRLLEIPSNSFKDAENLLVANFSTNLIQRVYADAFVGAKNIITLDLSVNQLQSLEEHTFDSITKLRNLNLSCNPIGNLEIDTLSFLTDLEYLSLRRTNLTDLIYGTFSFQPKLISLDLSENSLKYFDFDLFIPFMQNLQSLRLNDNELRVLVRFENELFPNLSLFDIRNNQFRCVFLIEFIKSVNWSNIYFPLDPSSANRKKTSIRGITCD